MQKIIDVEECNYRSQRGFGTLLVYSVNDVYYRPKHKVGERSKCSNIPQQQYIRKDENEKARRFPRP